MRYCICGRVKKERIATVEYFIHDFKIVMHRVPHFFCSYCKTRSYDSDGADDIIRMLKMAYQFRIGELEYMKDREKLRD